MVTLKTGNKINVGLQGTNGELPMVTDESGNQSPLTAELEAKSFNVGTGNEFNIRDNGTATFTEAFSSSGGKTVIDGKLVVMSVVMVSSKSKVQLCSQLNSSMSLPAVM